jgi:basic membrane lipoprotein Med (substrate-binding protein (PBP1-ABC) superfamily)
VRGTRWGALAAALALVAGGASACGSTDKTVQVRSVALVTPGSGNDLDWTRQARDALERMSERHRVSASIANDVTTAEAGRAVDQVAREGADLILADESSYAPTAVRAARAADKPVLVWGDRAALESGKVGDVEIAAAQGGYAAGALSSHATDIKHVAVLVAEEGTAWDAQNWNRMAGGFIAGARREVPDVRIDVQWVGGPDGATPAAMKRAAAALIAHGAQTLFSLGGRSAIGVLRAIDRTTGEQEYAGVIGDKSTVNTESDVVTSVVYNFDWLFRRAISDARAGTFGDRPYTLSFGNGGLQLLSTGRTPSDAYEAALQAARDAVNGKVQVPDTPTRAEVRALLRGGAAR